MSGLTIFGCFIYFLFMACAVLTLAFDGEKHSKRAFVYALTMALWTIAVKAYSPPNEIMAVVMGVAGAIVLIWAVVNLIKLKSIEMMVAATIVAGAMFLIWAVTNLITAGSINLEKA